MINYSVLAMQSLVPNCQFSWGGPYNYKDIDWLDSRPIPTETEWETEKTRLVAYQPLQECKTEAKRLLSDSDWSELPSVVEALENADEWKSYRVQLRKYVVTPVQNPVFPSVPQVKWKE